MKDISKMEKMSFTVYVFITFLFSLFLYNNTIFRCCRDWTLSRSRKLFIATTLLSIGSGFILYFKSNRHRLTMFTTAVSPLCIYTFISYYKTFTKVFRMVICVTVVLSILFTIIPFPRRIVFSERRHEPKINRVYGTLFFGHTVFVMCMSAIVIKLIGASIFSYNMLSSRTEKPIGIESDFTVENYTDEIMKLDDMIWVNLSAEEKLDLLQVIANIESNRLGLSNELNVGASNFEKDSLGNGTIGRHNDLTHSIVIDLSYLELSDSMSCVEIICHEAYHSYEHNLVRVYQSLSGVDRQLSVFNDAPVYEYEFDHPIHPNKDYEGYYDQLTEINAREYAREEVICYYKLVTDFKGECEPSDDDIDIGTNIPPADDEIVVKL